MFEAKVATIILPVLLVNILSNELATILSLIVYPGLSTFVLSAIKANTPSFPSSANLAKSITSPDIGVKSTLKSPVWIITPTGVFIANAEASGIL